MIAQPEFASQGCVFVLKTDKPIYEAGDSPAVEIAASNLTDKPVDAAVWINISASSPSSPMLCMMPIPRVLWSHECRVSLQPGETSTVSVASETKLPAGQNISITLSDNKAAVVAERFHARNSPGALESTIAGSRASGFPTMSLGAMATRYRTCSACRSAWLLPPPCYRFTAAAKAACPGSPTARS